MWLVTEGRTVASVRPTPVSRTRVVTEQDKPAVLAPHVHIVSPAVADDGSKDDGSKGKSAGGEIRPAVPV